MNSHEAPLTNWAGNHTYGARDVARPATLDDLRRLVAAASSIRVLGSRHSFTDIGDADTLLDMRALPQRYHVDHDASTITVPGTATYAEVADVLATQGAALHNLASLPHISVAGAVATATHGSGVRNGNLSTAVAGLTIVDAAGDIRRLDRSSADLAGAAVSLGALGPVVDVTLDVVPAFDIEQQVVLAVPLDAVGERLVEILSLAYSVSVFTAFDGDPPQGRLWVKRSVDGADGSLPLGDSLMGWSAATTPQHPIDGVDPTACTEQLGVPGPWSDRLAHFRMGFTPSAGDEVQSEFFVDVADGPDAFRSLVEASGDFADRLLVSEVRAVAADELWMSPQYRRATVAFHFTWRPDGPDTGRLDRAVRAVEAALAPYHPVPHWGKYFVGSVDVEAAYARIADFRQLVDRFDPAGNFRNDWWRRIFVR